MCARSMGRVRVSFDADVPGSKPTGQQSMPLLNTWSVESHTPSGTEDGGGVRIRPAPPSEIGYCHRLRFHSWAHQADDTSDQEWNLKQQIRNCKQVIPVSRCSWMGDFVTWHVFLVLRS